MSKHKASPEEVVRYIEYLKSMSERRYCMECGDDITLGKYEFVCETCRIQTTNNN